MIPDNIEVHEVYEWLNKFNDGKKSYLGKPVEKIISQIMGAVAKDKYPEADYFIKIAINVSESMGNSLEQAETHFNCGYAYYQVENFFKAIIQFRQAEIYYDIKNNHNQALTNWLLGCAYWRTMNVSKAIVEWERSCKGFQKLQEMSTDEKENEQAIWYEEIGSIMCEELGKAIKAGRWPLK